MSRRGKGGRGRGRGRAASMQPTPPRQPNHRHSAQARARPPTVQREASTPAFSLAQEAAWMASHHSNAFEPGKQLRSLKIEFVSAGLLQSSLDDKEGVTEPPTNTPSMAAMALPSPSPSPSIASTSSSEDEVVFRGRGSTPFTQTTANSSFLPIRSLPAPAKSPIRKPEPAHVPQRASSSSSDSVPPSFRVKNPVPASGGSKLRSQVDAPVAASDSDMNSDTDIVVQTHFERRLGGKTVWESNTPEWEHRSKPGIGWLPESERPPMHTFLQGEATPQAAAMDDYVHNVKRWANEGELLATIPSGFSRTELDLDAGHHNDWQSELAELQNEVDDWNADTLGDLDGLSTSSDVIDTIERILSKRTRKSGLQYLVVYEGSTPDDARWLPVSFLKTSSDLELIRIFDLESMFGDRRMGSSSADSHASGNGTDDSDDSDDTHISDERLARILQTQEELELGTDEVLLYGDDEIFDDPVDIAATLTAGFDRPSKKRQHRAKGSSGRRQPRFPSASAMADALDLDPYKGFDVMDTDHPSLRPRKKGHRAQLPPELEDADLHEQLQASWEADRCKKRLKKAEREELRKQGLLGRKGKSPKLSVKYRHGVTMPDVVQEIREFLISDMQTLSLPPMEIAQRAVVHQFVAQLGLTSKSRGDGHNRFTVLAKTSRTRPFDEDFFESLIGQKRFNKRLQRGSFQESGPKIRSTVSYQDGDTVGASAPELGRDNKGHALMEKMGWTKGMALGAGDNKGILQPIAHIVKTSKLGLQ